MEREREYKGKRKTAGHLRKLQQIRSRHEWKLKSLVLGITAKFPPEMVNKLLQMMDNEV